METGKSGRCPHGSRHTDGQHRSYTDESRLSYFQQHDGQGPPPGTLLPGSTSTAGGGITWPRWVSTYSGASLFNYAVSGAVCSNDIVYRYLDLINGPFPDVLHYAVPAYAADAAFVNASTRTNTLFRDRRADNSVYSLWIGTNDLGNAAFLTGSALGGASLADYADCVFAALDGIYATGARHFVLMALAPLELLPQYARPDAGGVAATKYWPDKPADGARVSETMREYVAAVNAVFAYRVPFEVRLARRYPGAHVALFDTHALLADVHKRPAAYADGSAKPMDVEGFYLRCPADGGGEACVGAEEGMDGFMW